MDWKKLIPFVVGIILIAGLIWWAGTEDIVRVILRSSPFWLTMAFAAYFFGVLTWALRWHVLLRSLDVEVSFKDTFVALFVGILFNNLTPGARGGGEAVRMYYLKKRSSSTYGIVLATITADRILDLFPVVLMLLLSAVYAYLWHYHGLFVLLIILNILLLSATGIFTVIITSERRVRRTSYAIFNFLARLIPSRMKKYEEKFNRLIDVNVPHFTGGLKLVIKDREAFWVATGYSFLTWFFVILRNYFLFLSLHVNVSLVDIAVVQMIATAVGLVSVIPGGAGLIEATSAGLFVALGINREVAVTVSIVDRVISFWLPMILGFIVMGHFGLKPQEPKTSS